MKKLSLLLLCVPLIGLGQKVELLNNSALIMSKPYYQEDNPISEVIASTDTMKFGDGNKYSLNAIDWVYNTKNELWLEVECLDWSTAECCDCRETKRGQGWIIKEDIFAPSLFSGILMPLTIEMIDEIGLLEVVDNKNHKVHLTNYGWYIKGYGGVLFMQTDDFKYYVNIGGKFTKLGTGTRREIIKHSQTYPNKYNLRFNPFTKFTLDVAFDEILELKIFDNRQSDGIKYIEIYYQGMMERIIITESVQDWEQT